MLHVIDKSFLGGGQAAVRNLLEGFRGTGIATELACRNGGPLVQAASRLGVPVHIVPFDKRFRPGPARAVARIVRGSGVDVIHAHGLVAAAYATMARSLFGAAPPLLYHQHGFHHHNYGRATRPLRRWAERQVARRADRVIPVSRADAELLESGGYASPARIELVHYGIPDPRVASAEIAAVRLELLLPDDELVVGIVGRLHEQKGIDLFLEAAAIVRRQMPSIRFVIVGTGELEGELRQLAASLGLDGSLRWVVGRSAAAFVPLIDVAVVSSRWEGLPLVLLEYMAAGRPIVTTDVAGCLEAVGPKEAAIVERYNAPALAEGMLSLLRDRAVAARLGAAARARYLREFTLASMAKRFQTMYEELLAQ